MTLPYPSIAQFMSAGAGLGAAGKKAKTHKKRRNNIETMLMGNPNFPRLNFDGNNGSPRILFSATQEIEMM